MTESTSPFKGVRGGDPARTPPKFESTHPCKNCGKPHTDITDFGLPSKHVCEECMDAKRSIEKCMECGSRKGTLIWNYRILQYELYSNVVVGYSTVADIVTKGYF